MRTKILGGAALLAVLGAGGAAVVSGASASEPAAAPAPASRLDDGEQYLSQAKTSEREAIAAAQSRASGDLNEVDLEHAGGKLVWNVDVGSHDVKVDATTGEVTSVDGDD